MRSRTAKRTRLSVDEQFAAAFELKCIPDQRKRLARFGDSTLGLRDCMPDIGDARVRARQRILARSGCAYRLRERRSGLGRAICTRVQRLEGIAPLDEPVHR